eukprot:8498002-Heterocapsa_arctica.AAC.1
MKLEAGRYLLHEHPATATSWKDPEVTNFMRQAGVDTTVMHACQYGMTAKRPDGSYGPVHKTTRWMSNSPGILARLT